MSKYYTKEDMDQSAQILCTRQLRHGSRGCFFRRDGRRPRREVAFLQGSTNNLRSELYIGSKLGEFIGDDAGGPAAERLREAKAIS
jgi:hypothetical protein